MSNYFSQQLSLIGLVLFTIIYSFYTCNFSVTPYEDAVMLLRYADHLAMGEGIVWNIGESPVDGATDFLFMVMVAALSKFGFTVELSAQLLGIVAHILTVILIYLGAVKIHKVPLWIGWLLALYLLIGPGIFYVNLCLGT